MRKFFSIQVLKWNVLKSYFTRPSRIIPCFGSVQVQIMSRNATGFKLLEVGEHLRHDMRVLDVATLYRVQLQLTSCGAVYTTQTYLESPAFLQIQRPHSHSRGISSSSCFFRRTVIFFLGYRALHNCILDNCHPNDCVHFYVQRVNSKLTL